MKKSKKIVLGLAFLIVFGLLFNIVLPKAKAMTVEEILAKIAQLQQQIAQLQKQLSAIQEPAVWCHNFNRNLRYGDAGPEVKALQIALEKEGFYKMEPNQPPYFDEKVASAVTGFQEKYRNEILTPWGLKYGTGFVGRTTRAKLNALYGCGVVQGSECQRNGGVCINFLAECKEGYQESSFSCKYKNEKCCVPVKKSIKVISPNGGEKWEQGNTYLIKWQVKGIRENLNIYLYREYGDNKRSLTLIAGGLSPEVTHYSWTIPSYQPTEGKYKISVRTESYGGMFSPHTEGFEDKSDGYFSIVAQEVSECTDSDGGKDYYTKGTVTDEGKTYADYCIDSSTLREYFCLEKTAGGLGGVAEEDHACPYGCENGVCQKAPKKFIKVISPNGGEEWGIGKTYQIRWKSGGITREFQIMLESEDTGTNMTIAKNISSQKDSYSWTIPSFVVPGNRYKISIQEMTPMEEALMTGVVKDYSDNYFSIVTLPDVSAGQKGGDPVTNISETQATLHGTLNDLGGASSVEVWFVWGCGLPFDHTTPHQTLTAPGSFSFTLTGLTPGTTCGFQVKASNTAGISTSPQSQPDAPSFTTEGINVISPNGGERWEQGKVYTIKWDNSPDIEKVSIYLENWANVGAGGPFTRSIVENISASVKEYSWTITVEDFPIGDSYMVQIVNADDSSINDRSDGKFSIVEAGPLGLKEIENQLAFISQVISRLAEQIKELLKR